MRVLLIYPGHSHSTYDVARGYHDALKSLGHSVKEFCYHTTLAFYQEALKYWMKRNPKFVCRDPGEAVMILASEPAVLEVVDFVPNLVIIVNGFALHRRAYDLIDRLCVPMALLLTESPYLDEEQKNIIEQGHIRIAFTNDKYSVEPLREMTHKRVEYLPHSCDPNRHHHKTAVLGKYDSDVFFFGTMWPERERLLKPVQRWCTRHGYKAKISGISHGKKKGMIDNDQLVRYYSRTKVALNHHRTIARADESGEIHVTRAYSLGPRAYEIAACGAFQLCDDTRPELAEVFGDSVATYRHQDNLMACIPYYLRHEAEREQMAADACKRAQACSFVNRARDILLPAIEDVM